MKSTAKVVVFFLIAQFLAGCEKVVSPKRPAGIAENAIWQGAEDGGNWVSCELHNEMLRCVTYFNGQRFYTTRDYMICSKNNLSHLLAVPDSAVSKDAPIGKGTLFLRPLSPSIIYKEGSIHEAFSARSAREFEGTQREECDVELKVMN